MPNAAIIMTQFGKKIEKQNIQRMPACKKHSFGGVSPE